MLHVRNVTDIDDKILTKAAEAGRPWWEWATTHERSFYDAYDALGCLRPSIEPRATGHIPQIVEMIAELIDSGHAYAAAGDVYFAVRTQPDYGFLSGQRIDEMVQGETEAGGKRDPGRLHHVEGGETGRAVLGLALGAGPARLAYRVLGDGPHLPRQRIRHPRRRTGSDLSAPRERGRAIARRR